MLFPLWNFRFVISVQHTKCGKHCSSGTSPKSESGVRVGRNMFQLQALRPRGSAGQDLLSLKLRKPFWRVLACARLTLTRFFNMLLIFEGLCTVMSFTRKKAEADLGMTSADCSSRSQVCLTAVFRCRWRELGLKRQKIYPKYVAQIFRPLKADNFRQGR